MKWKVDENKELPVAVIEDTEDGFGICELGHEHCNISRKELEKTACLIAAAPDLLAACELALSKFRLMYNKIESGYDAEDLYTDSKSWPLTTLRNAIAKAKS